MGTLRRSQTPPPTSTGRTVSKVPWRRVLDECDEFPGEWVEVPVELNVSVANHIRRGQYQDIPYDTYDVTARRIGGTARARLWLQRRVPAR